MTTVGAQTNGTWRVVGNAGAVPIHALPFTDETVLFWERNSNNNGSSNCAYNLRVSLCGNLLHVSISAHMSILQLTTVSNADMSMLIDTCT